MADIAEVDVEKATGKVTLVDYVDVVDCGTVVNANLARVQAEGGIAQGIGMALTEEVSYSVRGRSRGRSFMTYKLPARLDIPQIRIAFEPSFEPTGPFGAKSIGEVAINTPSPPSRAPSPMPRGPTYASFPSRPSAFFARREMAAALARFCWGLLPAAFGRYSFAGGLLLATLSSGWRFTPPLGGPPFFMGR